MAKHANPTVVGGFVVGAVVLTVGGIMTFGSGAWLREEFKLVAYFEDSVSGLDVGAPIRYKGVQVGNVSRITAAWHVENEELRIPVELTFVEGSTKSEAQLEKRYDDPYTFMEHLIVDRGLKATLAQDSFVTGKLFVALDFLPDEPIQRLGDSELSELPTTRAGLSKLKKSIADLPIEKLVNDTISAINAFEALAKDPRIDELLTKIDSLAEGLDREIVPLATDARTFLQDADKELELVSADLRKLLENVDGQVEPLSSSAQGTMDEATKAFEHFNQTFGEDYTLYYRVAVMLEELGGAARAVRILAEYLDRHPEALISGRAGQ